MMWWLVVALVAPGLATGALWWWRGRKRDRRRGMRLEGPRCTACQGRGRVSFAASEDGRICQVCLGTCVDPWSPPAAEDRPLQIPEVDAP